MSLVQCQSFRCISQRCPQNVALRRTRKWTRLPSVKAVDSPTAVNLLEWLKENGAPRQGLEIRSAELPGAGRPLDVAVAARDLVPGDVALSIPERLVVTLDRIFETEAVAELLTTGKLSELACLALYLMYEKKVGTKSFWYQYIKELDKQRARGVQAVESPLLWGEEELEDLLQGSPVVAATKARLAGIRKEYDELDTVWFMAGSLFNRYPFDIPTEAFSFNLFKQAFAAVQASTVHLQGVPPARRFALVPLGPPLLTYSSTARGNMLAYNPRAKSVELVVDRSYTAGDPVYAWCGPQPNSRLLINYGIVDINNPYDKLQLTVTLATADPLFKAKRAALTAAGLGSQQAFDLTKANPLPPLLLPFLRLGYLADPEQLPQVRIEAGAPVVDQDLEQTVVCQLTGYIKAQLGAYKRTLEEDLQVVEDPASTPRQRVSARLTSIEKSILLAALAEVEALPTAPCSGGGSSGSRFGFSQVRFS